jgi:hypothetical protein
MRAWKPCALAIALAASLAQAQEPEKTATYPRRVKGEELAAHFQGNWSVNGFTSTANRIAFFNSSDGSVRIRQQTTSRVPDGFGTREVKTDKNQVCLNITTTTWRGITGCYRLEETEPKAFALVRGSYRIEYRR